MTRDDDGGYDPNAASSTANTTTGWLDDFKPVQAKLTDMHEYAEALLTISGNLQDHRMRVTQQMRAIVEGGAFAGGFPEVNYAGQLHAQNLAEFTLYLQQLSDGLEHSANAAQVIADSYGANDEFSAIGLDAVQFAFADPSATRPSGFPPSYHTTTFSENAANQLAAQATGKSRHDDAVWTPASTTTNADGGTTVAYTDQYGETMTITIAYAAGGHKITTTTGPDGTTEIDESSYSYPLGAITTTTTTTNGKTTTSESQTYTEGDTTVTDRFDGDTVTSETTVTDNADGSQITTVYTVDPNGKRTVAEQYRVGEDNPVQTGVPDSPADDAINHIRAGMPSDHTITLAPGPELDPGSGQSTSGTTV